MTIATAIATAAPRKKNVGLMNQFAKETGVAGVHMLRPEIGTFEKAFWLLVAVFLAALTGRDLVKLTQAYLDENLITTVSAVMNDSVVFDPPPSIRISCTGAFLSLRHAANLTNQSLIEMLEGYERKRPADAANVSLTERETQEMGELARLNVKMMNMITTQEKAASVNRDWGWAHREGAVAKPLEVHMWTMFDFYRARNISMLEVKEATGVLLCRELRITVSTPDGTTEDVCTRAHMNELLGDGFSLVVHTEAVTFTSWRQALTVEFAHRALRYTWLRLRGGYTVTANEQDDAPVSYDMEVEPLTFVVSVRLAASFDRVESAKHACLHETRFDCATECIVDKFLVCARCWPLMFSISKRQDSSPETVLCPADHFVRNSSVLDLRPFFDVLAACRTNKSSSHKSPQLQLYGFWDECQSRCWSMRECETKTYEQSIEKWPNPAGRNASRAALRVVVESFAFPIFAESPEMTWDSYLAQCGGSLGLYLGLSFAALVHVPMFFVRLLARLLAECGVKIRAARRRSDFVGSRQEEIVADDEMRRICALEKLFGGILSSEALWVNRDLRGGKG